MSTIYKWQDTETLITSTTTANLLRPQDPVLVNSLNLGQRPAQAAVGQIATLWPTSTTTSSATALPPYGIVSLTPGSTTQAWTLSTATQPGQCVTLFLNSTTTSSQNTVQTASTANMTFVSTDTYAGITITFNQNPKGYVELTSMSVSTANAIFINPFVWAVTGRSGGIVCT